MYDPDNDVMAEMAADRLAEQNAVSRLNAAIEFANEMDRLRAENKRLKRILTRLGYDEGWLTKQEEEA